MRRFVKTGAATALIGACVAAALAAPALAATPLGQPHSSHHDINGKPARHASPIYRCNGGRYYAFGGGWGCDYYLYSESYAPRRR